MSIFNGITLKLQSNHSQTSFYMTKIWRNKQKYLPLQPKKTLNYGNEDFKHTCS